MEKKVIKINLLGAICVVILIIAIIIGVIVEIPKLINKSKSNKGTEEQKGYIDENKEYAEKITNSEGNEIESKLKICKSDLGYTMKYDYELFTVEKNVSGIDKYISLYSNTIGVTVQKEKGTFNRLPEYLNNSIQNNDENLNQNKEGTSRIAEEQMHLREVFKRLSNGLSVENVTEYTTVETELGGRNTFKRTVVNEELTDYLYCVQIDEENFFIIHAYCGDGFKLDVLPVVENMVNSFTIIEEK